MKTQGLPPLFFGLSTLRTGFPCEVSLGNQDVRFYRRAVLWPIRAYNGILALGPQPPPSPAPCPTFSIFLRKLYASGSCPLLCSCVVRYSRTCWYWPPFWLRPPLPWAKARLPKTTMRSKPISDRSLPKSASPATVLPSNGRACDWTPL